MWADFVSAWGKVSDQDFYRIVTCGAPPGRACREPEVRWPPNRAQDLRVRLEAIPAGFDKHLSKEMLAALDNAIAQLNGAGARLALHRVGTSEAADIRVFLTVAGDQEPISGTGIDGIDGEVIGAGLTTVWVGRRLSPDRCGDRDGRRPAQPRGVAGDAGGVDAIAGVSDRHPQPAV